MPGSPGKAQVEEVHKAKEAKEALEKAHKEWQWAAVGGVEVATKGVDEAGSELAIFFLGLGVS